MKHVLNRLIAHESLSREESRQLLIEIAEGAYDSHQVASFMTIFMMRSITVDELTGFQEALQSLCVSIDVSSFDPIDLCGTGGDQKDTFNISTLASFVTAGAGVPVAKHGNYGVSSSCGSSNVMEYLGIHFTPDPEVLKRCLDQANICIFHAPLFHPAMKAVAPIRKALGVKTFFNMLGPLVNPGMVKKQLVGVFSLELARLYAYRFQQTDMRYTIVHALDGYDEVSLTSAAKLISPKGERLVEPSDFAFNRLNALAIAGGNDIQASAQIFMNVLEGKGTPAQNQVVLANAALAIATAEDLSIVRALERATESLEEKKALTAFNTLKKVAAL
jgi:anthranilate phosphoribosyltransferase